MLGALRTQTGFRTRKKMDEMTQRKMNVDGELKKE